MADAPLEPPISPFASIAIGIIFELFGLFFPAAVLVVVITLVRGLYLHEAVGEDIARIRHPSRRGADNTPRDSREFLD